MRIIKNFALNSNFSINCLDISPDLRYIAFGDTNKSVYVFNYLKLTQILKSSNTIEFNDRLQNSELKKFQHLIFNSSNLPKLTLDYHNDSVNSVLFAKVHKSIVISGSSDKCIIVWKINDDSFTSEKMRVLKNPSDINELCLYPNDAFIFSGCIDNNIYIWKANFIANSFENIKCISIHTNFITSLCLDPNVDPNSSTGKLVSYSDEGRLVLSEVIFEVTGGVRVNVLKDYKEFINVKNKINSIQKKIDWSNDGKWIVSVNHHYVKNHKVSHARLVNMGDISTSQILVGHESAVLVAKFSKTKYSTEDGKVFSMLATSDKTGNLILWKIENNSQFRILTEITNFSESTITNMTWSPNGDFLFTVNSNGSVYILEFPEFNPIVSQQKVLIEQNSFPQKNETVKRIIQPTMISNHSSSIDNISSIDKKNEMIVDIPNTTQKAQCDMIMNPNQGIQECLRCQRLKLDTLETKVVYVKLERYFKERKDIYIQWENKVYDNYCTIQFGLDMNEILYSNKFEGKLIRSFTCNNFYYAFYDTQNTVNAFTILNTIALSSLYIEEVVFIDNFANFLLIVTSLNNVIVYDVYKREKVIDTSLNINSLSTSLITTKISSVKFLDLNRIIFYLDSYNVFKNTNSKHVMVFDRSIKELMKFDHNEELETSVFCVMKEHQNIKSIYNKLFSDNAFWKIIDGTFKVSTSDAKDLTEMHKRTSEALCYERELLSKAYWNLKNEFMIFMKNYLAVLAKNSLLCKMSDFLNYIFHLNEMKYFSFLDERSIQAIKSMIQEVTKSDSVSKDMKDYLIAYFK